MEYALLVLDSLGAFSLLGAAVTERDLEPAERFACWLGGLIYLGMLVFLIAHMHGVFLNHGNTN